MRYIYKIQKNRYASLIKPAEGTRLIFKILVTKNLGSLAQTIDYLSYLEREC